VTNSPGTLLAQINSAIKLVESYEGRMAIYKNKLVPFKDVVKDKVVSMSGSQVLCKARNEPILEFEFSTKSVDNVLGGIQRHMSSKQRPDPIAVAKFQ